MQVAGEIIGCLGAHAESGAREFFDRQQSGKRGFLKLLHESGDGGIELISRHDIAHQTEGERFLRVDLLRRVDQEVADLRGTRSTSADMAMVGMMRCDISGS